MILNWLRRWGRDRSQPQVQVVMFTRAGCHLCEDAWELLQQEQQSTGFVLSSVDIAGDHELEAKYGMEIPVVQINGTVRFRGRVNPVLLRRLLRSLQSKSVS